MFAPSKTSRNSHGSLIDDLKHPVNRQNQQQAHRKAGAATITTTASTNLANQNNNYNNIKNNQKGEIVHFENTINEPYHIPIGIPTTIAGDIESISQPLSQSFRKRLIGIVHISSKQLASHLNLNEVSPQVLICARQTFIKYMESHSELFGGESSAFSYVNYAFFLVNSLLNSSNSHNSLNARFKAIHANSANYILSSSHNKNENAQDNFVPLTQQDLFHELKNLAFSKEIVFFNRVDLPLYVLLLFGLISLRRKLISTRPVATPENILSCKSLARICLAASEFASKSQLNETSTATTTANQFGGFKSIHFYLSKFLCAIQLLHLKKFSLTLKQQQQQQYFHPIAQQIATLNTPQAGSGLLQQNPSSPNLIPIKQSEQYRYNHPQWIEIVRRYVDTSRVIDKCFELLSSSPIPSERNTKSMQLLQILFHARILDYKMITFSRNNEIDFAFASSIRLKWERSQTALAASLTTSTTVAQDQSNSQQQQQQQQQGTLPKSILADFTEKIKSRLDFSSQSSAYLDYLDFLMSYLKCKREQLKQSTKVTDTTYDKLLAFLQSAAGTGDKKVDILVVLREIKRVFPHLDIFNNLYEIIHEYVYSNQFLQQNNNSNWLLNIYLLFNLPIIPPRPTTQFISVKPKGNLSSVAKATSQSILSKPQQNELKMKIAGGETMLARNKSNSNNQSIEPKYAVSAAGTNSAGTPEVNTPRNLDTPKNQSYSSNGGNTSSIHNNTNTNQNNSNENVAGGVQFPLSIRPRTAAAGLFFKVYKDKLRLPSTEYVGSIGETMPTQNSEFKNSIEPGIAPVITTLQTEETPTSAVLAIRQTQNEFEWNSSHHFAPVQQQPYIQPTDVYQQESFQLPFGAEQIATGLYYAPPPLVMKSSQKFADILTPSREPIPSNLLKPQLLTQGHSHLHSISAASFQASSIDHAIQHNAIPAQDSNTAGGINVQPQSHKNLLLIGSRANNDNSKVNQNSDQKGGAQQQQQQYHQITSRNRPTTATTLFANRNLRHLSSSLKKNKVSQTAEIEVHPSPYFVDSFNNEKSINPYLQSVQLLYQQQIEQGQQQQQTQLPTKQFFHFPENVDNVKQSSRTWTESSNNKQNPAGGIDHIVVTAPSPTSLSSASSASANKKNIKNPSQRVSSLEFNENQSLISPFDSKWLNDYQPMQQQFSILRESTQIIPETKQKSESQLLKSNQSQSINIIKPHIPILLNLESLKDNFTISNSIQSTDQQQQQHSALRSNDFVTTTAAGVTATSPDSAEIAAVHSLSTTTHVQQASLHQFLKNQANIPPSQLQNGSLTERLTERPRPRLQQTHRGTHKRVKTNIPAGIGSNINTTSRLAPYQITKPLSQENHNNIDLIQAHEFITGRTSAVTSAIGNSSSRSTLHSHTVSQSQQFMNPSQSLKKARTIESTQNSNSNRKKPSLLDSVLTHQAYTDRFQDFQNFLSSPQGATILSKPPPYNISLFTEPSQQQKTGSSSKGRKIHEMYHNQQQTQHQNMSYFSSSQTSSFQRSNSVEQDNSSLVSLKSPRHSHTARVVTAQAAQAQTQQQSAFRKDKQGLQSAEVVNRTKTKKLSQASIQMFPSMMSIDNNLFETKEFEDSSNEPYFFSKLPMNQPQQQQSQLQQPQLILQSQQTSFSSIQQRSNLPSPVKSEYQTAQNQSSNVFFGLKLIQANNNKPTAEITNNNNNTLAVPKIIIAPNSERNSVTSIGGIGGSENLSNSNIPNLTASGGVPSVASLSPSKSSIAAPGSGGLAIVVVGGGSGTHSSSNLEDNHPGQLNVNSNVSILNSDQNRIPSNSNLDSLISSLPDNNNNNNAAAISLFLRSNNPMLTRKLSVKNIFQVEGNRKKEDEVRKKLMQERKSSLLQFTFNYRPSTPHNNSTNIAGAGNPNGSSGSNNMGGENPEHASLGGDEHSINSSAAQTPSQNNSLTANMLNSLNGGIDPSNTGGSSDKSSDFSYIMKNSPYLNRVKSESTQSLTFSSMLQSQEDMKGIIHRSDPHSPQSSSQQQQDQYNKGAATSRPSRFKKQSDGIQQMGQQYYQPMITSHSEQLSSSNSNSAVVVVPKEIKKHPNQMIRSLSKRKLSSQYQQKHYQQQQHQVSQFGSPRTSQENSLTFENGTPKVRGKSAASQHARHQQVQKRKSIQFLSKPFSSNHDLSSVSIVAHSHAQPELEEDSEAKTLEMESSLNALVRLVGQSKVTFLTKLVSAIKVLLSIQAPSRLEKRSKEMIQFSIFQMKQLAASTSSSSPVKGVAAAAAAALCNERDSLLTDPKQLTSFKFMISIPGSFPELMSVSYIASKRNGLLLQWGNRFTNFLPLDLGWTRVLPFKHSTSWPYYFIAFAAFLLETRVIKHALDEAFKFEIYAEDQKFSCDFFSSISSKALSAITFEDMVAIANLQTLIAYYIRHKYYFAYELNGHRFVQNVSDVRFTVIEAFKAKLASIEMKKKRKQYEMYSNKQDTCEIPEFETAVKMILNYEDNDMNSKRKSAKKLQTSSAATAQPARSFFRNRGENQLRFFKLRESGSNAGSNSTPSEKKKVLLSQFQQYSATSSIPNKSLSMVSQQKLFYENVENEMEVLRSKMHEAYFEHEKEISTFLFSYKQPRHILGFIMKAGYSFIVVEIKMCLQQQLSCADLAAEKFNASQISFLIKAKNQTLPWMHIDAKEINAAEIISFFGPLNFARAVKLFIFQQRFPKVWRKLLLRIFTLFVSLTSAQNERIGIAHVGGVGSNVIGNSSTGGSAAAAAAAMIGNNSTSNSKSFRQSIIFNHHVNADAFNFALPTNLNIEAYEDSKEERSQIERLFLKSYYQIYENNFVLRRYKYEEDDGELFPNTHHFPKSPRMRTHQDIPMPVEIMNSEEKEEALSGKEDFYPISDDTLEYISKHQRLYFLKDRFQKYSITLYLSELSLSSKFALYIKDNLREVSTMHTITDAKGRSLLANILELKEESNSHKKKQCFSQINLSCLRSSLIRGLLMEKRSMSGFSFDMRRSHVRTDFVGLRIYDDESIMRHLVIRSPRLLTFFNQLNRIYQVRRQELGGRCTVLADFYMTRSIKYNSNQYMLVSLAIVPAFDKVKQFNVYLGYQDLQTIDRTTCDSIFLKGMRITETILQRLVNCIINQTYLARSQLGHTIIFRQIVAPVPALMNSGPFNNMYKRFTIANKKPFLQSKNSQDLSASKQIDMQKSNDSLIVRRTSFNNNPAAVATALTGFNYNNASTPPAHSDKEDSTVGKDSPMSFYMNTYFSHLYQQQLQQMHPQQSILMNSQQLTPNSNFQQQFNNHQQQQQQQLYQQQQQLQQQQLQQQQQQQQQQSSSQTNSVRKLEKSHRKRFEESKNFAGSGFQKKKAEETLNKLRIVRNKIAKYGHSQLGGEEEKEISKPFLEEVVQHRRIVFQTPKVFENTYTIVTILKDLVFEQFYVSIYIAKTSRLIQASLPLSNLVSCSWDFFSRVLSDKFFFFFDNSAYYHTFLNYARFAERCAYMESKNNHIMRDSKSIYKQSNSINSNNSSNNSFNYNTNTADHTITETHNNHSIKPNNSMNQRNNNPAQTALQNRNTFGINIINENQLVTFQDVFLIQRNRQTCDDWSEFVNPMGTFELRKPGEVAFHNFLKDVLPKPNIVNPQNSFPPGFNKLKQKERVLRFLNQVRRRKSVDIEQSGLDAASGKSIKSIMNNLRVRGSVDTMLQKGGNGHQILYTSHSDGDVTSTAREQSQAMMLRNEEEDSIVSANDRKDGKKRKQNKKKMMMIGVDHQNEDENDDEEEYNDEYFNDDFTSRVINSVGKHGAESSKTQTEVAAVSKSTNKWKKHPYSIEEYIGMPFLKDLETSDLNTLNSIASSPRQLSLQLKKNQDFIRSQKNRLSLADAERKQKKPSSFGPERDRKKSSSVDATFSSSHEALPAEMEVAAAISASSNSSVRTTGGIASASQTKKRDTRGLWRQLVRKHRIKLVYSQNSKRIFELFRKESQRKTDKIYQFAAMSESIDQLYVNNVKEERRQTHLYAYIEAHIWSLIIAEFTSIEAILDVEKENNSNQSKHMHVNSHQELMHSHLMRNNDMYSVHLCIGQAEKITLFLRELLHTDYMRIDKNEEYQISIHVDFIKSNNSSSNANEDNETVTNYFYNTNKNSNSNNNSISIQEPRGSSEFEDTLNKQRALDYFFNVMPMIGYTETSKHTIYIKHQNLNDQTVQKMRINLREVVNLFIAEGFFKSQINYINSKVSYAELKQLCHFIIYKIRTNEFFDIVEIKEKPSNQYQCTLVLDPQQKIVMRSIMDISRKCIRFSATKLTNAVTIHRTVPMYFFESYIHFFQILLKQQQYDIALQRASKLYGPKMVLNLYKENLNH